MPFAIPNIPYAPPLTQSGAVTIATAPSASPTTHRVAAAFSASEPSGQGFSLCSLGYDLGAAPWNGSLAVSATGVTFERAVAATFQFPFGFFAFAQATAGMRVFIEEFTAGGGFIGGFPGPMTTIFNKTAIFGANIYSNTQFTGAFFRHPTVAGRRYRFWVDLVQSAIAVGFATAVSNCTLKIGPNYPPGSPQDQLYGNTVWWAFQ